MNRFVVAAGAAALCTLPAIGPTPAKAPDDRALPMQFELRTEGPAELCQDTCRTWVSATGAITIDTPREFDAFSKKTDLRGKTLALDSDGGSVHGAIAFGRLVRKLAMITTVGKSVDLPAAGGGEKRSKLLQRAYCESMCAFVLLAGVERHVPAEARVLVHQIWLGDRRDDPTAAHYSAEDLVLVQRDIGRLAQYTMEMGGNINLLETALRIPPWEPMRLLSREELRGMKIVTAADAGSEVGASAATSATVLASGARAAVNGRSWVMADRSGRTTLSRKHPLTIEGEDIGMFELMLACGDTGKDYIVTYTEQRRANGAGRKAEALTDVEISVSGKTVQLQIVSSQPTTRAQEMESVATGSISADLIKSFADVRSRSLSVETSSEDTETAIRIGNAGVARTFSQFAAACAAQAPVRSAGRDGLRREAEAQPR